MRRREAPPRDFCFCTIYAAARRAAADLWAWESVRQRQRPVLGICYGMQMAVIEFVEREVDAKGQDSGPVMNDEEEYEDA